MPQLMQNLEDSSDPTSAMNEALSLMAKAFKLNTIPTNNNQRKIANQYGNGNVVTAPLAYLQQQLQIAQEEESEIQKALRGSKFMATDAIEETERVKKLNKLEDENVPLELQVHSYAKENEHLKTTYKNLFDSIKVTQAQTKSIIDSLQKQLYDTIYENAKLRAQLFDKVSKPKGTTKGTRTNTMFKKQSILGKPPFSSSSGSKLYSVTPFPKSSVLPKVDRTNALSKPVTLNSAPFHTRIESWQTVNVMPQESLGLIPVYDL
ncbi:hypothetical protein Tco_0704764 [Tanacetum coccineum]|uniref:Uncharacterized protein n=1 Tax=Tanacetum coccineum TaxID=301880 RepID=A0ABQ4Y2N9_9ASTR